MGKQISSGTKLEVSTSRESGRDEIKIERKRGGPCSANYVGQKAGEGGNFGEVVVCGLELGHDGPHLTEEEATA